MQNAVYGTSVAQNALLFTSLERNSLGKVVASNRIMTLTGNGNIGIGTTDNANWQLATSTYKLAVNGSVIATSMTVKNLANWPDYVFKPAYQLPTLTEVKTYIDQNHHLPDVPTAADVEKNGLNLGEMNKVLLQKVEELTLYLIEKDKVEKQQKEQLRIMDQHIKLLETKLDQLLRTSH